MKQKTVTTIINYYDADEIKDYLKNANTYWTKWLLEHLDEKDYINLENKCFRTEKSLREHTLEIYNKRFKEYHAQIKREEEQKKQQERDDKNQKMEEYFKLHNIKANEFYKVICKDSNNVLYLEPLRHARYNCELDVWKYIDDYFYEGLLDDRYNLHKVFSMTLEDLERCSKWIRIPHVYELNASIRTCNALYHHSRYKTINSLLYAYPEQVKQVKRLR